MNENIKSALAAAGEYLESASGDYGTEAERAFNTRRALAELLRAVQLLAQDAGQDEDDDEGPEIPEVFYDWCPFCKVRTSHLSYSDGRIFCETCGAPADAEPEDDEEPEDEEGEG